MRNLARHLTRSGNVENLRKILCDVLWILKRINIGGWPMLNSDFNELINVSGESSIRSIKDAV